MNGQVLDYECSYCGMIWQEKTSLNQYGRSLKGNCPRCDERAPYAQLKEEPSESKAGDRPDA